MVYADISLLIEAWASDFSAVEEVWKYNSAIESIEKDGRGE